MNIQAAQVELSKLLQELIRENPIRLAAFNSLLIPPGYIPKLELNSATKSNPRQLRKKRADASIESFDPRTDRIVWSFEPAADTSDCEPSDFANTPVAASEPPTSRVQYEELVLALSSAEEGDHEFIGLNFFRDHFLTQLRHPWVRNDILRRTLFESLIAQGWIETGKMPNPQSVEFPVTTIKLNRQHPAVEAILKATPSQEIAEFRPIRQTGEPASRVILRDRR